MKLLDDYLEIQEKIYSHFGYREDWIVFPIDDAREYYWHLSDNEVHYSRSKSNLEKLIANDFNYDVPGVDASDYYSNQIIAPFLPKGVYRTNDYTMVCVDTETDGNRLLQIFDNSREL